jgi:hypothetical protein
MALESTVLALGEKSATFHHRSRAVSLEVKRGRDGLYDRPPPRSVRAEFPHMAPALGM